MVGDIYKTLSEAEILLAEAAPDILNGATMLWLHIDDKHAHDIALKIKTASNDRIHIRQSPNAIRNRIHGFKGRNFLPVLVIKLKEE